MFCGPARTGVAYRVAQPQRGRRPTNLPVRPPYGLRRSRNPTGALRAPVYSPFIRAPSGACTPVWWDPPVRCALLVGGAVLAFGELRVYDVGVAKRASNLGD